MQEVKQDLLNLGNDVTVAKMISKNSPTPNRQEAVFFSDIVIKINKYGKEQERVLLVTDYAVYNLLPKDFSTCKRRIQLEKLVAITASSQSSEFVFHVPEEYDYRYKSAKKSDVAECVAQQYRKLTGKKLRLNYVPDANLTNVVLTKDVAKHQTREEKMRRKKELLAEEHDSDKEEEVKEADDKVAALMDTNEKATLSDFDLLKVIGRGSFGKVMQVRKKDTGKVYAMKILKKDAIVARNQVEHTKAERSILEALQHPFLMGLRYAFQTREKLYFVLDYFQGGELFFHLRHRRRFNEDEAKLYIAEIASALGHLHKLNIIYRDLKPENILLDEVGHVCLTDFGLSREIAGDSKAHTFCGTPEYLAPEVVMGCGHNKEVDWWSLGILLYELTVGIPPFYSQNVNEMYQKIQHGVLRFPPFLSDECKSLIVGLLNRDPAKRLGSGARDFDDIKAHPFFRTIDWEKLLRKEIDPPYKPTVQSDIDTSNFDKQFTDEPVVDSYVDKGKLTTTAGDQFSGFTFQPRSGILDK